MELADPRLLQTLLSATTPRRRPVRKRDNATADFLTAGSKPQRPPRRCRCGACPLCLENARWERIFAEKFADPKYYQRDQYLRRDSSLNW